MKLFLSIHHFFFSNCREEFFKDAGEVVDIRFASNEEGRFKGFGHVEFATEEAALKVFFPLQVVAFYVFDLWLIYCIVLWYAIMARYVHGYGDWGYGTTILEI